METQQEIKIVLPKRPKGYWVTMEGRAEKQMLSLEFDNLSDEEKLKYNEKVLKENGGEVIEDPAYQNLQNNTSSNTEEKMVPASEVANLVKQILEEEKKKSESQKAEKQPESIVVNQIKNELFDDLPELQNFKAKERIYVLCDGSKPISRGLATRHKDGSPLQYINKETGETYALFYSLTQTSFFKEKHKGDSKVEHVHFKDGMLKTYENDIKLQKFLRIHPGNEAMGGNLFREYNPSKEAELKIEDFELETKARNLAIDLPFIKQDAIARLLCVDYKEDWTTAEIKKALFQEAIKSPTEFIKLANDTSLEVKGVAKTGVHRGILTYKNYRFYNEKGDVLVEVQRNQDEWQAIADYFMSGEGRTTYEFVRNAIG